MTWNPISLSLNMNGDIIFGDITPSEPSDSNYGTLKIIKKNISYATNGRAIDVYLSTNNSTAIINIHKLPLSIPFTGYYGWASGNLGGRGSGGAFWSSTPNSSTGARYLDFSSNTVLSQNNLTKSYGLTVRCVAR